MNEVNHCGKVILLGVSGKLVDSGIFIHAKHCNQWCSSPSCRQLRHRWFSIGARNARSSTGYTCATNQKSAVAPSNDFWLPRDIWYPVHTKSLFSVL